jgi:hypothetical protein
MFEPQILFFKAQISQVPSLMVQLYALFRRYWQDYTFDFESVIFKLPYMMYSYKLYFIIITIITD